MKRHRTATSAILSLVLVFGTAGAAAGPAPVAMAASAPAGDLIVSGVVERGLATRNSTGGLDPASIVNASPEAGATVSLQFFPSVDAKVGQSIPIREVARATTDRAGAYRLAAQPDPHILSAAGVNDGWVNFELVTTAGADLATEMLPRHWNGRGWDAPPIARSTHRTRCTAPCWAWTGSPERACRVERAPPRTP